jgi:hypothetical protein
MTKLFQASVLGLDKIYDMPGTWTDDDYRSLLQQLEIEDIDEISPADLLDFVSMALQDIELEPAADLVLAHKLQKSITRGSRQNLVEDFLQGQRPWEEASDIMLHARIFAAGVLLNKAFPRAIARPDMMRLTLQLRPLQSQARKMLQQPPEAAFVTRLLADGMDEHSILERLFDEQLVAHAFPEAEGIIWLAHYDEAAAPDGDSKLLRVYSSQHWLEDMESVSEFESNAYNDREPDDDES